MDHKIIAYILVVIGIIAAILALVGLYVMVTTNSPEHNHKFIWQYQPVSNISVGKTGITCGQWNPDGADTQVAVCWNTKTGIVLPAYRYVW